MFGDVFPAFVILTAVTTTFGYCPKGWLKHKKQCYILFSNGPERKTGDEAEQFCHQHEGTLMNLKTKELYNMAVELLKARRSHGAFIGLNDKDKEGDFRWGDGERPSFTMWEHDEPNGRGFLFIKEDCVYLKRNGLWNDVACDDESSTYDTLCERSVKELFIVNPSRQKQCSSP